MKKQKEVVRVKVTRRRLKLKNIFIFLFSVILLYNLVIFLGEYPIKNIYIIGNSMVSDYEIIKEASLEDYPSFLLTFSNEIEKGVLNHSYIKEVSVEKKFWGKLYITVLENKPLCKEKETGLVVLDNGDKVEDQYELSYLPILLNDPGDVYEEFVKKFSLVDKDILSEISQIEYSPVMVDPERFYLAMNDGNYVYVTLTKIKMLNKYYKIRQQMGEKKGIIYLDSGNYIEIKEDSVVNDSVMEN